MSRPVDPVPDATAPAAAPEGARRADRRRVPWSLRAALPAMIVLAVLAVVVQQYLVTAHFEARHAREDVEARATALGARLAGDAGRLPAHGDRTALEHALGTAAALHPSDLALVVDGDDRVLASSDRRWRNRPLTATPLKASVDAVRAARLDGAPRTEERGETVIGVHPLPPRRTGRDDSAPLASRVVVLGLSAAARLDDGRRRILTSVPTSAGLVLGIGALFWLGVRRLLLGPLDRLLSGAGSGESAREIVRRGGEPAEELARVADAFDALSSATDERERALAAQSRLARIVEASLNEVYVVDAESLRLLDANRAARTNLGYSAEEMRRLHLWDVIGGEDRSSVEDNVDAQVTVLRNSGPELRVIEDGWNLRKDGTVYPVSVQVQYIGDETPPVVIGICQDLTERRRHDEHPRLHRRAIEAVEAGVLITDASIDGYPIVYANRALCEMTGYAADELIGRSPSLLQGEHVAQPGVRLISEAQSHGSSVRTRLDCIRKDGGRFVIRLTLSPVHDPGGALTHYIGIHEDITRETETETRLLQAQRIDAVGRLAGGVAHDFNNLLDIVVGNLELVTRGAMEHAQLERVEEARRAANMGAKLTRRLLAFARQSPLEPSVIDVDEWVRDTLPLVRSSVGESIVVHTDLAGTPWLARVDPSEIENTVVNLVINARDAIGGEGRIRIATEKVGVGADGPSGVGPGDYVRLSVSDDGCGMSDEVGARAFEPFFTTKETGRGTGLGLASVHGFATQSGGGVELVTGTGAGTTVSVYLPRYEGERCGAAKGGEAGAPRSFQGRVLIVEDNDKVREITNLRLRSLGFETLETGDGAEAKRILEGGERVDLVLSDVVMPGGVSGYDLARWIRESERDCPVLLTSGFADPKAVEATFGGSAPPRVLAKPYGLAALREAIDEALGPGTRSEPGSRRERS